MANRINYQLEMEKVLRQLGDTKPTLLLHACCAPCSSATLERLAEHFRLSILYYNPNIYPPAEYHRREAGALCGAGGLSLPGHRAAL